MAGGFWRLGLRQRATSVQIKGGRVLVMPIQWTVDLRTGKVLAAGGRNRNGMMIQLRARRRTNADRETWKPP